MAFSSDEEEESAQVIEKFKAKRTNSKRGRKCVWPENVVNDLVDVILENGIFKKKLLLTNVKTVKNGEYYNSIRKL